LIIAAAINRRSVCWRRRWWLWVVNPVPRIRARNPRLPAIRVKVSERVVGNKTIEVVPGKVPDGVAAWPICDETRIRLPARWTAAVCCRRGTVGLAGFPAAGPAIAVAL